MEDVQCDFWFWIIWGPWRGRDREAFAGNLGEAVDYVLLRSGVSTSIFPSGGIYVLCL